MQTFSESLSTDLFMWEEDVLGSVAHATMLAEVGLLTEEESSCIISGLEQVSKSLKEGWRPEDADEDIHMAIERRLTDLIGPVAGKLHTARSRNDQVSTDVRLWMRARIDLLSSELTQLLEALINCAETQGRVLVPGYTHLQRAQPIWFGHQLMAHAWGFLRDIGRFKDARRRVNLSPLGAAAMAGTPHPINRERTAELLHFDGVMENAMDAVSARDHVMEVTGSCAILAVNLSRLAAELVLWSSTEFSRVRLSDEWSTGSSIMPQKRNPDAPELIRGKTGHVIGNMVALLTLVKGLPMAYNRDLQEDRPALFDAVHTTLACVRVMTGCIKTIHVNEGVDLEGDFSLATELADYLTTQDVSFRDAHEAVGRLVGRCEERGHNLSGLSLEDLRWAHEAFKAEALDWLHPEHAVERRQSRGGTAWSEIMRQVSLLREQIGS
jgi:argininosuccinate lyase